jgi:hypothetical protein
MGANPCCTQSLPCIWFGASRILTLGHLTSFDKIFYGCWIHVSIPVRNFRKQIVVGMTSRVGQGRRCMPADVPGISTALSQEDRLHPKGRLRQQPAGDSTEEGQSRWRRQDPSNGCFAESGLAPTRSTEAREGHDASHVQTPPTSEQDPSPRKDPRQKGRAYASKMPVKGGKGTL